ncbi:hypothetical protein Tco_0709085 [Tanacetum coccineum]
MRNTSGVKVNSNVPSDCPELLLEDNRWDKKSFKDKIPSLILENPLYQRLGRHLVNVRTFLDHILFLVGLKPLWEHGQQQPAIFVYGKEIAFRNSIMLKMMKAFPLFHASHPLLWHWSSPAKANSSLFLTISDHEEEASKTPAELQKIAIACRLMISNYYSFWLEGHLEQSGQAVVDNAINQRAREPLKVVEQIKGEREFDKNLTVMVFRQKNVSLLADVEEHKESVERMLLES